jgi:hypothetical protein
MIITTRNTSVTRDLGGLLLPSDKTKQWNGIVILLIVVLLVLLVIVSYTSIIEFSNKGFATQHSM